MKIIKNPLFWSGTKNQVSSTARKSNVDRVASSTNNTRIASSTKPVEMKSPPSSSDDREQQNNSNDKGISALLQHRNERKLTRVGYGFEKRFFSDPQFKLAHGINDSNIEEAMALFQSIGGIV